MNPYWRSDRLKAEGNLSYLDFLRLVNKLWADAHPNIPFIATGPSKNDAIYPCISYRLDFRKPHQSEPKPRPREEIPTPDGEDAILLFGQRFQNVVTFTATAQWDPQAAEALIEVFENFMIEFTPIFKELGASDLLYARRLPDGNDMRPGIGIVERSVSYLLTTEKIVVTTHRKLENILVDARVFMASNQATPDQATPNAVIAQIVDTNGAVVLRR